MRGIDGRFLEFYQRRANISVKLLFINNQPPTSPPLSLRKALLPPTNYLYQFTEPMGWITRLARTHVCVYNFLKVITLYAQ